MRKENRGRENRGKDKWRRENRGENKKGEKKGGDREVEKMDLLTSLRGFGCHVRTPS